MGSPSQYSVFSDETLQSHLRLLEPAPADQGSTETSLAPLMTSCAFVQNPTNEKPGFTQFGLLAGVHSDIPNRLNTIPANDRRLFLNVSPPSSTFICGSQGSGKSHTLSCMLENCLIPSIAGHLPSPLTGVVFHYDTFISDSMGSPCEAAFLSTHPQVNIRVLCAPTNIHTIRVRLTEMCILCSIRANSLGRARILGSTSRSNHCVLTRKVSIPSECWSLWLLDRMMDQCRCICTPLNAYYVICAWFNKSPGPDLITKRSNGDFLLLAWYPLNWIPSDSGLRH